MSHLSPTGRKWALSIHLLCVCFWLGAAVSMMTVAFLFPEQPETDAAFAAYRHSIKLIDDWVIIASAGGSLVSGLVLSWKTKWGFFQWYWVAVKLVTTVLLVCFGALALGPAINSAAAITRELGLAALDEPAYLSAHRFLLLWGTLQILILIGIVGISVFKPWGKLKRD